jgi:1-acyl-sn-glycerol-3-phosphate acyltransferase
MQIFSSFVSSTATFAELSLQAAKAPVDTLTGWSLEDRDPQVIEKFVPLLDWFYHHYFRVKTDGWENIPPSGQVLFIGSHNGGLAAPDMFMMMYDWFQRFGSDRLIYGLMDSRVWRVFPPQASLAAQMGAIHAHPKMAIAALNSGASVLIYPGGATDVFRPHSLRNKIHFAGNLAFVKLALQYEVPIIPAISHGAHSTLFVLDDIYPQLKELHEKGMPWPFGIDPGTCPIYFGLPWGLAIGPLPNIPLPVAIQTRVCPPIIFERYGKKAARDRRYVRECYEKVCYLMQQQLDQLVAANSP